MFKPKATDAMQSEAAQKLMRKGKRITLFRLIGDAAGSWRTVMSPYEPGVRKYLEGKYGPKLAIIANEDFEAAAQSIGGFGEVDNRFSDN